MFKARFSTKTMTATIHAAGCNVVAAAPFGITVWPVEAKTADEAAQRVYTDESFKERGIPKPKCCRCCK